MRHPFRGSNKTDVLMILLLLARGRNTWMWIRRSPAPVVVEWLRAQADGRLYTTSITLAEVLSGVRRLPDGQRKDRLNAAATEVFDAFSDQVRGGPRHPQYQGLPAHRG
jgi:hypothetical protein